MGRGLLSFVCALWLCRASVCKQEMPHALFFYELSLVQEFVAFLKGPLGMKKTILIALLTVLFAGCATLTPVVGGKSRMQYNRMAANQDPQVPCYMQGFRGGALFVDILLLPLILPILIDAATGSFTYYYFDPSASNPRSKECVDPSSQIKQNEPMVYKENSTGTGQPSEVQSVVVQNAVVSETPVKVAPVESTPVSTPTPAPTSSPSATPAVTTAPAAVPTPQKANPVVPKDFMDTDEFSEFYK